MHIEIGSAERKCANYQLTFINPEYLTISAILGIQGTK